MKEGGKERGREGREGGGKEEGRNGGINTITKESLIFSFHRDCTGYNMYVISHHI